MSTRYFFLLFFTGALNLAFAQEKLSFSDQQLKLSFGPLNGQPNFFEFHDFEWSKGLGISLEYNNHFSKRFSWGCEFGYTYDYDSLKPNRYSYIFTDDGIINISEQEWYHSFMRNQYSIIPQISYHIVNRPKLNINLTGGFGLFSEKVTRFTLTPNRLVVGSLNTSFLELFYVGNFALSVDYKISPHVFAGVKVQDHIFLDSEFRSLRLSLGYVID